MVPEKYDLQRLSEDAEMTPLAKAVEASDGSLFFTVEKGSPMAAEAVRKRTAQFNKPMLVVNLDQANAFGASRKIAEWIGENRIGCLHVDGAVNNAAFNAKVAGILEATFFLTMMNTGIGSPLASMVEKERIPGPPVPSPTSLDAALIHLEKELSLKDKATIANMVETELVSLHFTLGNYINNRFDLFSADSELLTDCRRRSGRWTLAPEETAAVIIRFLWEHLRETYRIRIIK
ncbi:DUF6794 domain-containing protein [Desulfosarcina cetonica]|uniref:DUF6794 domain-containing protein n=1 Tax=Desulfosarcina cetonica TaxID=90730 RepID=UPI0012ECC28C|nr:DUF6794 domain-containing protein [Desulfosarcina cetonica]